MQDAAKMKDAVLERIDARDVLLDIFPDWQSGKNQPCPFAAERHEKGEDASPSLSVSEEGKAYCHACGWKATSVIGILCDLEKKNFGQVCRELWGKYIEPLVPEVHVKACRQRLVAERLVISRLSSSRAVPATVAAKYELGWDGFRITIPIRNEHGLCANVRRYDILKRDPAQPKVISYAKGFGHARLWPLDQLRGDGPLFIFEGEMDTLCAIGQGLRSATVTIGASVWKDEWSAELKGQDVVLVPDVDKAGLAGADKRAASIKKQARSVRVLRLPLKGGEDGKDFTDWVVKKGGSKAKFLALLGGPSLAQEEVVEDSAPVRRGRGDGGPALRAAPSRVGLEVFEKKSPQEEINLARAEAATKWLSQHGSFFKNQDGDLFYAESGGKAMRVGEKSEQFIAYLANRLASILSPATSSGRFVIRHILSHGYSTCVGSVSSSFTLFHKDALFVYAGRDKIVRVANGKMEVLKNATNEYGVLLECPDYNTEWEPVPDADPRVAMGMLWDMVAAYFPVSHTDRYLVLSWLLGLFLKEYVTPKPLLRLMARTAYGKSTMSKMLSLFIYGAEIMQQSATTNAATYALSQRYPLLLLDNVETRNMTQWLEDFLINAATGGGKWKRQLSTDSAVIREQANCLVVTNGIEPINKRELISRTIEIQLDIAKYGTKGFYETQVFAAIKKNRGYMFSGLLKALSIDAVPRLKGSEAQKIAQQFGGHSKERFDEYLGLAAIVLDVIWKYRPSRLVPTSHAMVAAWLRSQTRSTDEQDEGTNDVLYFLSELADRRGEMMDARTVVDKLKDGRTHMVGSTRQLLSDFRLLARKLSIRCPWQSERHLASRLADAEQLLTKQGWIKKDVVVSGRKVNDISCKTY